MIKNKKNPWKNIAVKSALVVFLVTAALLTFMHYLQSSQVSVIAPIGLAAAFGVASFFLTKGFVSYTTNALREIEKGKARAEVTMQAVMDASPLCCQYWSENLEIIDCNEAAIELYGFTSKTEYQQGWSVLCNPLYQPDGQHSITKAKALVEKAFAEGHCTFEWMHRLPDGTPLPTEITLRRVGVEGASFVIGFTRDLRKEKKLEERADENYIDAQTGVYNKKYMDNRMVRTFRMLSRTSGYLTLMLVDVDNFQAYVDAYGENAATDCLGTIAGVLCSCARRGDDFVARVSSSRFAIVLPNTHQVGARMIADKMLSNVRWLNLTCEKDGASEMVTISIGVTTGVVNHRQRSEDYINRAGEMLYVSTQGGCDKYSYADL